MRERKVAKAFSLYMKEDGGISVIGLLSKKSHLASWQIQNPTAMCQMWAAAVGPSAACFCAICHFYTWSTGVSEAKFTVQLFLHYSRKFNQKKVNRYPARLESEHRQHSWCRDKYCQDCLGSSWKARNNLWLYFGKTNDKVML